MNDPMQTQAQRIVVLEDKVEGLLNSLLYQDEKHELLRDKYDNLMEEFQDLKIRLQQIEWEYNNS